MSELLVLAHDEVRRLLPMDECIDLMAEVENIHHAVVLSLIAAALGVFVATGAGGRDKHATAEL